MASEMVKLLDGATTTTALAIKAGATALPTKADGYRSLAGRSVCAVRLKFGATRSAGDNETFAYQIYLWRRRGDLVTPATATLYDPEEVARGVCTIGTKTYTDGGATHYEVDTITNTIAARAEVYVFSPADDRTAWIYVNTSEALGVQVIPDRDAGGGTAVATLDVWVQELGVAEFSALPMPDRLTCTMTPIITVVSIGADGALSAVVTLNAATKRITLRPHAIGIYMDEGAASAASDPLGTNTIEMMGSPGFLGALRFYAAVATNMTVIEEG